MDDVTAAHRGDRGARGAADEIDPESPIAVLAAEGFTGTLATNSELEFVRYLRVGDRLESATALEAISERKGTALGQGYFVTWVTTYTDEHGEVVGRQRFRIYKFAPGTSGSTASGAKKPKPAAAVPTGDERPDFELDVTPAVVVAGDRVARLCPEHRWCDIDLEQDQLILGSADHDSVMGGEQIAGRHEDARRRAGCAVRRVHGACDASGRTVGCGADVAAAPRGR